ncbi:hypothetical protein TRIUR3_26679 [Triticum urartu]|uniref:Uncharacterized protein n=1 Tax=Triticum urartu TaxID=4572 RepID=M7ZZI5_TRIUA|nr:hypothetical protein TRIUR3_26679 [Triticum urartu]
MDAEVFASGRSRGDGEVAWASAVVLLVEGEHARRRQDKLIESRPGLEFSAIRRKCSWPESPSANPSNPGILGPEKHHVAFEFAEGRRTEFAGANVLLPFRILNFLLLAVIQCIDSELTVAAVVERAVGNNRKWKTFAILSSFTPNGHSYLIPYYSFEQFVRKVEEVGASNHVRINFFLPLRVCFHTVGQQDLSPTMRDRPSEISYRRHNAPAR